MENSLKAKGVSIFLSHIHFELKILKPLFLVWNEPTCPLWNRFHILQKCCILFDSRGFFKFCYHSYGTWEICTTVFIFLIIWQKCYSFLFFWTNEYKLSAFSFSSLYFDKIQSLEIPCTHISSFTYLHSFVPLFFFS